MWTNAIDQPNPDTVWLAMDARAALAELPHDAVPLFFLRYREQGGWPPSQASLTGWSLAAAEAPENPYHGLDAALARLRLDDDAGATLDLAGAVQADFAPCAQFHAKELRSLACDLSEAERRVAGREARALLQRLADDNPSDPALRRWLAERRPLPGPDEPVRCGRPSLRSAWRAHPPPEESFPLW